MFPLSTIQYVKIAIFVLAVSSAGYFGWHIGHGEYLDLKARTEEMGQKQLAENQAKAKEQELINKGISDVYEARISNIHTFYNGMLNSSSRAVSSEPNATISINGETHNILDVAEQCAKTTQQLVSLQDFLNQQVNLDVK
jgi:hypothetical protein